MLSIHTSTGAKKKQDKALDEQLDTTHYMKKPCWRRQLTPRQNHHILHHQRRPDFGSRWWRKLRQNTKRWSPLHTIIPNGPLVLCWPRTTCLWCTHRKHQPEKTGYHTNHLKDDMTGDDSAMHVPEEIESDINISNNNCSTNPVRVSYIFIYLFLIFLFYTCVDILSVFFVWLSFDYSLIR